MDGEEIKLILQITDSGTLEEAIGKLARMKAGIEDVANTYALADQRGDQFVVTTRDISHALDKETAVAVEATMRQKALNQVLSESTVVGNSFGNMLSDNKMRILNAGRAIQDFAQGGIGGILNNIEGLVGGSGALAGVLTAVGVAAYFAWPKVKEWADGMGALGETFKPTAERLEGLTEAIKKNKEEMGKLKDQGELTYMELLKYKELVGKTAELEEQAANAREARAVKPGSSKKERERASAVRETIAEDFGSSELLIERIMESEAGKQLGLERVEYYVANALKGLDVQSLQNLSPEFKSKYTPRSPEVIAKNKENERLNKEADEFGKQARENNEAAAKRETKLDDDEAKGFGDFMRRQAHLQRSQRLAAEHEKKAGEQAAKQRAAADRRGENADRRAAQQRENAQFRRVMENIEDANVALERGFRKELDFAKMQGATQQMMDSIHRRHDFLKAQIEETARNARRTHQRNEESLVSSQLDN